MWPLLSIEDAIQYIYFRAMRDDLMKLVEIPALVFSSSSPGPALSALSFKTDSSYVFSCSWKYALGIFLLSYYKNRVTH
jgi:hypothetical protein